MIHVVIFGPLVLAWAVFCTHVKHVYWKRERLQVALRAIDNFSEQLRRMGMQVEIISHRMRGYGDKVHRVSEHYRGGHAADG